MCGRHKVSALVTCEKLRKMSGVNFPGHFAECQESTVMTNYSSASVYEIKLVSAPTPDHTGPPKPERAARGALCRTGCLSFFFSFFLPCSLRLSTSKGTS